MSRFIQIIDGDYGKQLAEFTLVGLSQKPALTMLSPQIYKNWLKRTKTRWIKSVWLVEDKIARIEKIEEGFLAPENAEWDFSVIESESMAKSFGKFAGKFNTPKDTGPLRNVKKIHFRLWFKDNTQCTAIADARVFQNIHAVVES